MCEQFLAASGTRPRRHISSHVVLLCKMLLARLVFSVKGIRCLCCWDCRLTRRRASVICRLLHPFFNMPGPRDEAHDPRVDEVAASFFQPPPSPPSATPTSATTMPLPVSFSLQAERPHHMSRPPGRVSASVVLTSLDPCGSAAVAAAAAVGGPAVLSRLTAEDGTWQNGSARRGSGLCSSGCLRRRRRQRCNYVPCWGSFGWFSRIRGSPRAGKSDQRAVRTRRHETLTAAV